MNVPASGAPGGSEQRDGNPNKVSQAAPRQNSPVDLRGEEERGRGGEEEEGRTEEGVPGVSNIVTFSPLNLAVSDSSIRS